MKKIFFAMFLTLFGCSFSFFDFHMSPEYETPYYASDDNTPPSPQTDDMGKIKIYLPAQEKIFKDEHGPYFYIMAKHPRIKTGGSGGFMIRSMGLNSVQTDALNAQWLQDNPGSTVTAKDSVVLWGGGGYWHASGNFYFGGAGSGGIVTMGSGSNRLKFSLGYGGIDFLILVPIGSEDFNFFMGSLIGAGGLEMESKTTNKYRKSFWIVEPKAGVQINFAKFFAMRLMASYLYSQDIDSQIEGTLATSVNFDNDLSLRNMMYSIVFEWGTF